MRLVAQVSLVVILLIAGASLGYLIWFLALMLGGAGHGWSAAMISWTSIIGFPMALVGWMFRKRGSGRVLSLGALVVAIGTDAVISWRTLGEPTDIVRVWRAEPEWLASWACLFLLWQILAVSAFKRKEPSHPPEPGSPSRARSP